MDASTWHHTTADVGLAVALDRLPSRLRAGDATLRLHAPDVGAGSSRRHGRSVPVRWSTGRRVRGRRGGDGRLEVVPLASGGTSLLLHLDAADGTGLDAAAPRVLRGLRDHLETSHAAAHPQAGPRVRRRRALAATALLGVPAGLLLATSTMAPTPVSVDDRVATFRADAATDRGTTPTDGPPPVAEVDPAGAGEEPEDGAGEEARGPSPEVERGPVPGAAEDDAGGSDAAVGRDGSPSAETSAGSAGGRDDEPTAPRMRRPEPGVYQYATTGGDRLSMRGSARDYPETTFVTVRHDDCGFTQRWDVLDERWEERRWCVEDERRALTAMSSYREFFGHGQRNDLTCEGPTPSSDAVEPGVSWTVVCENEDTSATSRIEVGGRTEVEVDGAGVDTLQLMLETTVEGESTGRMAGEQWIVPDTGLLVREQWETEVETAGPMGPVTYTEDYTLLLESMEPSR
jgi:hypothetical protein